MGPQFSFASRGCRSFDDSLFGVLKVHYLPERDWGPRRSRQSTPTVRGRTKQVEVPFYTHPRSPGRTPPQTSKGPGPVYGLSLKCRMQVSYSKTALDTKTRIFFFFFFSVTSLSRTETQRLVSFWTKKIGPIQVGRSRTDKSTPDTGRGRRSGHMNNLYVSDESGRDGLRRKIVLGMEFLRDRLQKKKRNIDRGTYIGT